MSQGAASDSSQRREEEDEILQKALAIISEDSPDCWKNVAALLPSETQKIESSLGPTPSRRAPEQSPDRRNPSRSGNIPAKRTRWTMEEHRLFLTGLQRYGRGKWKKISERVVKSKSPQQVTKHAYGYLKRQDSAKRRRRSRYDTTVGDGQNGQSDVGETVCEGMVGPSAGEIVVGQNITDRVAGHDDAGPSIHQDNQEPLGSQNNVRPDHMGVIARKDNIEPSTSQGDFQTNHESGNCGTSHESGGN